MEKKYVLGLDISTSCTGVCLMEDNNIILLFPIKFSKDSSFWEKADQGKKELSDKLSQYKNKISSIIVEEPLKSFKSGFSSADTISTLIKMNGILSDHARTLTGVAPAYIHVGMARSLAGVKLKANKEDSYKEQIVDWVTGTKLPNFNWEKTKTGNFKPEVGDMCDAYVLALAGSSDKFDDSLEKKKQEKLKKKNKRKKEKEEMKETVVDLLL